MKFLKRIEHPSRIRKYPTLRPLLAESGPKFHPISADLNGRFREKRTFPDRSKKPNLVNGLDNLPVFNIVSR